MIRTIVQCDICGEEIHSEEHDSIRAMPTESCEMHFHHKCFQQGLYQLMESSPRCKLKRDFLNCIIEGKFVGEVLTPF
jgi:hypothetical protein